MIVISGKESIDWRNAEAFKLVGLVELKFTYRFEHDRDLLLNIIY